MKIEFEPGGALSGDNADILRRLDPATRGMAFTGLIERMAQLHGAERASARISLQLEISLAEHRHVGIVVTDEIPRLVELYREASSDPDQRDLRDLIVALLATADLAEVMSAIPTDDAGLEIRVVLRRAIEEISDRRVMGATRSGTRGIDPEALRRLEEREYAAPPAADYAPPGAPSPPASGRGIPTHAEPPGPPSPRPAVGAEPVPGPDGAPTYRAYGVLACQELVLVGTTFDLTIGLDEEPQSGVSGPAMTLAVPTTAYDLEIQLFADGFDVGPGESLRNTLRVTTDDLFPKLTLHLTARDMAEEVADRTISAAFIIAGEVLGKAQRNVRVTHDQAEIDAAGEPIPTASGTNLAAQPGVPKADLTIVVERGQIPGTLQWSVESEQAGVRPDHPIPMTNIGLTPAQFAKNLIAQVSELDSSDEVFSLVQGRGQTIGRAMPKEVRDAIRAVVKAASSTADRATILIVTDEPFVPWELAVFDPPLSDELPPYLSAQANVGRWIFQQGTKSDPSRAIRATSMAVVSGVYTEDRLEAAEEEVKILGRRYGARSVDATFHPFMELLEGNPAAEIIHVAVHGKFDATDYDEGIILVGGETLRPAQIEIGKLKARAPLVFLNACQLGSATEVLGEYTGTAQAFLQAGAAAVIAPLWSVNDEIAQDIALDFYRKALAKPRGKNGQPPLVADLLRDVRRGVEAHKDKNSVTYLAYQFYGHPALRLSWAPPARGEDS